MIPRLVPEAPVEALYCRFLAALAEAGFEGDHSASPASRLLMATDNSLYQRLPQAVVYPHHGEDVHRLATLAAQAQYRDIRFAARGGGTGTNGQSLGDGLVVDLSRHMRRVLELDVAQGWVRVETGIVKDELNAQLRPYGLFFAPDCSTSNRATIGGMISTDACGQGSCTYGKTRNHVLELDWVLCDGTAFRSAPLDENALAELCRREDRIGQIHRLLRDLDATHRAEIEARFPPLNRCLTGYDLLHLRTQDGRFDLNSLLCGSEGTLAFLTAARLNLEPIPRYSALVNVRYDSFDASLRDARELMSAQPTAIETVDSTVLDLARNDIIWHGVSEFFPEQQKAVRGINLVEFAANDEAELERKVIGLTDALAATPTGTARLGYTIARGGAIQRIWGMRKRAVGLLGNAEGAARPVAFVEDAAVPPEHLADFIADFRALLDARGLQYGMFGHVDAGVLHVRPALDQRDPQLMQQVRHISDEVVALCTRYGGLLWGEHGKGVRSEYVPEVFGPLYAVLRQVKGIFDPLNRMNPGKIATPPGDDVAGLLAIDAVPTRGELDRQIPEAAWQRFNEAVYCNGNGACFQFNPNSVMCPSYLVTGDRRHSPKGRASLIREWLRLVGEEVDWQQGPRREWPLLGTVQRLRHTLAAHRGQYDFSHEVNDAMRGCLACKACAGQCPVKVNIPAVRSAFLAWYHQRYLRSLRDRLAGRLEHLLPWMSRLARLNNVLLRLNPTRRLLERLTGLVDLPTVVTPTLAQRLRQHELAWATPVTLGALSVEQRAKAVVMVPDAFNAHFEPQVLIDALLLLRDLGWQPLLAPFRPSGKAAHVLGMRRVFERSAQRQVALLRDIAAYQVPLVGLEPAVTLLYRDEYRKELGLDLPAVPLLQQWLVQQQPVISAQGNAAQLPYVLLAHCTERTAAPTAPTDWRQLFQHFGLQVEIPELGCCGMAGLYGHEVEHRALSARLYKMSWQQKVEDATLQGRLMATGYSCRSQVQREAQRRLPHPVSVLRAALQAER